MKPNAKTKKIMTVVILICSLIQLILEFMLHRNTVFVMDDLWYSTNLVTGESLACFADVWDSQVWHYINWGGRSINHGLLQLVLMSGPLAADLLNIVMTLLLSYLICELAGKRKMIYYCAAFIMMLGFNAAVGLSMFWESGAVNYVYCTNWILLFLIVYLRKVKNPDAKELVGTAIWMIPLGLITGWSNENMGPACFVTALIVIIYFIKFLHKKTPIWMWVGMLSSLCGSILMIAAPGNFVRSATADQSTIFKEICYRILTMLNAGTNYLFPTVIFLLFFLMIFYKKGKKLQAFQIILIITMILAFGAMVLSSVFPGRASFGIMVLGIALIISIAEEDEYFYTMLLFTWIFSLYVLRIELMNPLV